MQSRIIVPVLASLALFASAALAQNAPPPPPPGPEAGPPPMRMMHMNKEEMAKHHARRCSDRYAFTVGVLAGLEVKLELTGQQQSLFNNWKKVKLASAKAHADACAAMKMADMHASIIERVKQKEKMLKLHLADLQAELPALQALVVSLTDEQKHVIDRQFMHGPFGHGGPRGWHGRGHGHGHGHGFGRGPDFGPDQDFDPDDEAPPPED
jgi:hypothetical protein